MSETSINNGTAAATDALSSAAEQVRARATGAYDAAKSAAGYVGETASEYPTFGTSRRDSGCFPRWLSHQRSQRRQRERLAEAVA